MNENEFERLFDGYRESLGTCGRAPTPRRTHVRLRWAAAGAALLVASGVALWPADAGAKAVRRIETALSNVRSMDMTFEMQRPSGRWVTFVRERYRDGTWRIDSEKGRGQRVAYVLRKGLLLTDYARLDHATLAPGGDDFLTLNGTQKSALDYAKEMVDAGRSGDHLGLRVEHRGTLDVVVIDRPEEGYHAELTVDRRTELPVSSMSTEDAGPARGGIVQYRQTYRFDVALPDAIFAAPASKPVIDVRSARVRLATRWAGTLATVGATHVRDACVTADGTIWIAVSRKGLEGSVELPSFLPGYARLLDVVPSVYAPDHRPFEVDGEEVAFTGFAPLDLYEPVPTAVSVGFARRQGRWPNFAAPEDPAELPLSTSVLNVRESKGDVPDWFPMLALDRLSLELPIQVWDARAVALAKSRRDLEAAQAYERCADVYANFVVYAGYRPLEKAAAIYERLGQADRAAEDRRRAAALKAARER